MWKEWDRFKGDAHDAEAAANALEAALQASGQDWKAAFQKMTDACKACHESFRAEEEEGRHSKASPSCHNRPGSSQGPTIFSSIALNFAGPGGEPVRCRAASGSLRHRMGGGLS